MATTAAEPIQADATLLNACYEIPVNGRVVRLPRRLLEDMEEFLSKKMTGTITLEYHVGGISGIMVNTKRSWRPQK